MSTLTRHPMTGTNNQHYPDFSDGDTDLPSLPPPPPLAAGAALVLLIVLWVLGGMLLTGCVSARDAGWEVSACAVTPLGNLCREVSR